jgi:hypothetical protein
MDNTPARRTGGGAALINSVTFFVTNGRKASVAAAAAAWTWKSRTEQSHGDGKGANKNTKKNKKKKRTTRRGNMADENKCSPRMVEALKKNTHFTR